MDMKQAVKNFAEILKQINNVTNQDVHCSGRFKIDARYGTKWSQKDGASKWGNIGYEKDFILIALDCPNVTMSSAEVVEYTQLTERMKNKCKTGFFLEDRPPLCVFANQIVWCRRRRC